MVETLQIMRVQNNKWLIIEIYHIGDSKSLRHSLQQNADSIIEKPLCTPRQAEGMAVLCGGPISQYVSEKSTITEFPKGPL